jgi:hypothetical protein
MATLKIKNEFKKILEDNDAFDAYIFSVKEYISKLDDANKELELNKINEKRTFDKFLVASFAWSKTSQGFTFWRTLADKYETL